MKIILKFTDFNQNFSKLKTFNVSKIVWYLYNYFMKIIFIKFINKENTFISNQIKY